MNRPPEPPPEGVLIDQARKDAKLSVREAARRAGFSEGWWRQVVKGYQSLSGGAYGLVRDVPADTVASMARVVGLTPEQLETEGQRPDAAESLRALLREPPARLQEAPRIERTGESFTVSRDKAAMMAPHIAEVEGRLSVWARRAIQLRGGDAIGEIPDGTTVFPDRPQDAAWWDEMARRGFLGEKFTLWQMIEGIAILRVGAEEKRQDQRGGGGVAAGLIRRLRTARPDVTIRARSAAF